jgi:hypothetical protein
MGNLGLQLGLRSSRLVKNTHSGWLWLFRSSVADGYRIHPRLRWFGCADDRTRR